MFFTKSINVYIGFPSLYCLSYLFFIIPSDATTYAHFLFNAFDLDRNGSIRFEVRISLLIVFLYYPQFLFLHCPVFALTLLLSLAGFCDRSVRVAERICH